MDGRNGRFGERIDEVSVLRILPAVDGPASTYSGLGGVLLEVPSAQTGEFGRYRVCSSGMVELRKSEIVKNKMVRFFAPVTTLLRLRLYLSAQTDASIREAYIKQVILTDRIWIRS